MPGRTLQRALALTRDGACAVDGRGRLFLWNRAAERLLGWSAREVLGRTCCEVLRHSLCDGGGEPGTRERLARRLEQETLTKAGTPIRLDTSILEVPAANGERAMTIRLFRHALGADEPAPGPLTRREEEILGLLASGAGTKAVVEHLGVRPATVRNHVQSIFAKLNVHSRLEAVAWANRRGADLAGPSVTRHA